MTQAEKAIRLYFVNFSKNNLSFENVVSSVQAHPDGSFPREGTLTVTQTVLRMKHYSYSTERTYLDWIKRFLDYLEETGNKTAAGGYIVTSDRIKDFLAYLATRRNVAASTQNRRYWVCVGIFH